MNVRSLLRLLVGMVIAALLLAVAMPAVGIPRSHLLPPALVYQGALGKTRGVVTAHRHRETSNFFHVGDQVYFLDYRFPAKTPAGLGVARPGAWKAYQGSVRVDSGVQSAVKVGQEVPVRYEITYPDINGIDASWGGRSEGEGSKLVSGWMFWAAGVLLLGYGISPLLERIWPRGNI